MKYDNLKEYIDKFPTDHKMGFTNKELEVLLSELSDVNINKEKFESALYGGTCMLNEFKEIITYHHDVFHAIVCGIDNRELTVEEWD